MDLMVDNRGQDLVIPAALVASVALILPALQTQPWWLILPCLICLILRWRLLAFALLFAAISYADTWASGVYYLGLSLLLLMPMHSNPGANSATQLLGALRQVLLSLPIFAVIVALAAGARWTEQRAPTQTMTGVSDTMTPGSVSELVNDSNLAMRVRFTDDTTALQSQDLYWRGLVLEDFDGRTWSRSNRLQFDLDPVPTQASRQLKYLVTLEPDRQFWLYGLHQAYSSRAQTYRDARGMLVTADMVRQRIRYSVTSILPPPELRLDVESRQRNLALPADSNPQTRQWIGNLRARHENDRELSAAVMRYFSDEAFFYTLTPTRTTEAQIDDFLFNTREGFCEHYAGALTFVLRAAGIPARVVTGYQGGDFNPITDHWTVYQYNAHAWVEAWFPGSGWERLDPTTQIAPERISSGIDAWLASLSSDAERNLDAGIRQRLQLAAIPGYHSMRNSLDALQYSWNLSMYDNEGSLRTEDLSDWLTGQGLGNLPVWLLAALLVFVGLRATLSGRKRQHRLSPALREYLRLNARLRHAGLGREPSETIKRHLERVSETWPENAGQWQRLGRMLTEAEYRTATMDRADIRRTAAQLLSASRRRRADHTG